MWHIAWCMRYKTKPFSHWFIRTQYFVCDPLVGKPCPLSNFYINFYAALSYLDNFRIDWYIWYKVNRNFENPYVNHTGLREPITRFYPFFFMYFRDCRYFQHKFSHRDRDPLIWYLIKCDPISTIMRR